MRLRVTGVLSPSTNGDKGRGGPDGSMPATGAPTERDRLEDPPMNCDSGPRCDVATDKADSPDELAC